MIRPVPACWLVAVGMLALLPGCGSIRPASTQTGGMPDYPRVAMTMTPGQTATYKGVVLTVVDIVQEDTSPEVMFTLMRGRDVQNYSAAMGDLTVSGDLLLQFQPRRNADGVEHDMTVAALYWLPDLMRTNQPRRKREASETKPGEIVFFQDGFAAIRSIAENDYVATDDDSVVLTIWTPGDLQEDINLREFSSFPIGETLLEVGNVYGGDQPGQGRVELSLAPKSEAWNDSRDREKLSIPYRGTLDWRGHTLRAESLPGGWRSRILMTVVRGDATHDVVLTEGQAWRHGNVAWRFDGVNGSAAELTAFEFDRAIFPADVRDSSAGPELRAQNPNAPTTIQRTLVADQSAEFWGARVRLVRVLEMDRTNLFDDVAELVFDRDGQLETVQVKEGDRATVRGTNRWWVVEVTSATPGGPNRSGSADVILSTGTFFNP